MGGEHDRLTAAEAASVTWLVDRGRRRRGNSGERRARGWAPAPRNRLRPHLTPRRPSAPAPEPDRRHLDEFRSWLGGPTPPLPGARQIAALPRRRGSRAKSCSLQICRHRRTSPANSRSPGEAWELTERMLAAIGFDAEQAYSRLLSCFHSPGTRLSGAELEACAEIARRHVALAKPNGCSCSVIARARFARQAADRRARPRSQNRRGAHGSNLPPAAPAQRPSNKALAWRDLLLLMEEEV